MSAYGQLSICKDARRWRLPAGRSVPLEVFRQHFLLFRSPRSGFHKTAGMVGLEDAGTEIRPGQEQWEAWYDIPAFY